MTLIGIMFRLKVQIKEDMNGITTEDKVVVPVL